MDRPTRIEYEAARARHSAATPADHNNPTDQLIHDTALINRYDHDCTCRDEDQPGNTVVDPDCPNHGDNPS